MKTQNIKIKGFAFVLHVDQNFHPELDLSFLERAYVRFYTNNDNLIKHGYYKMMGYRFDFSPYLKQYQPIFKTISIQTVWTME